ncbi:phosphoglycolate phosphatase [Asanoa ferruginea]|uniref:Phosphoglycolate phosphatase n=1 Tax=Asanoa ferruginea TaxID=53367 RepID=A0A3D9ZEB6_9ACTN|nr:HAD family hydrolase [Asanoa ferruginea]REF94812.1 phosphoglycolate phosphatase [Asanoa ferruginea]GIF45610.1 hypothetical protein Afe04nite_01490 [Asanoa ferruginea]
MPDEKAPTRITLVVTDLDNTLWDWLETWYASFNALLQYLVAETGLSQQVLEGEIRTIHQRRGTSEYSYLLNEIPSLQRLHPDEDLATRFQDGIHRYRLARKATSKLYPGVIETLKSLKERGVTIIGYTESLAYHSASRIKKFGLDGIIDTLYSPRDHDLPNGVTSATLRSQPSEYYELRITKHKHTAKGVLKPDPSVLTAIIQEAGTPPEQVVYIGDSLMKDVAMAQAVDVNDVWARYGVAHHRAEYDLLRRVSHWSDDDVERERRIARGTLITPTHTLNCGMGELLSIFKFGA